MRKRILAALLCACLLVPALTAPAFAAFPDVPADEWYTEYVDFCTEKGIVNGFEDGTFRPTGYLRRSEFIKMLATSATLSYKSELPGKHWAEAYWAMLSENGVLEGLDIPCTFDALQAKTTRYEMAVMIRNFLAKVRGETEAVTNGAARRIPDWAYIPEAYRGAVAQVYAKGIINGMKNTAGAEDGADVAALTPEKVELLRGVFWDMCTVSSEIKTVEHPASGGTAAWSEEVLFISISAKTAEEMRTTYALTEFQSQSLNELLAQMDTLGSLLGDLTISQADALELLQDLPADLAPERRAVVETACKLVGKVNYFWGGKSLVIGWDSRWGQLSKVWADGNATTGTYRPYGLDCSGFVDWTFYNASSGEYIIGHGGGAHAQHTYCTAISWEEAQPGDLVFYPEDTHVGIVGGRDENGNLLIVHCASGANNVVITGLEGFTSIGRPLYYGA